MPPLGYPQRSVNDPFVFLLGFVIPLFAVCNTRRFKAFVVVVVITMRRNSLMLVASFEIVCIIGYLCFLITHLVTIHTWSRDEPNDPFDGFYLAWYYMLLLIFIILGLLFKSSKLMQVHLESIDETYIRRARFTSLISYFPLFVSLWHWSIRFSSANKDRPMRPLSWSVILMLITSVALMIDEIILFYLVQSANKENQKRRRREDIRKICASVVVGFLTRGNDVVEW